MATRAGAKQIRTNTTNFNNNLSSSDITVQLALETLDDVIGTISTFVGLSDTPSSYSGNEGKLVKVNATGDGLIFGDPSGTTVSWGDIGGTLSNQTDLVNELNGKADTSHTHQISDITSLQYELDSKEDGLGDPSNDGYLLSSTAAGVRSWISPPSSTVSWGGIIGTLSDQTDLQSALNDKADVVHTHIISDIAGLQTALDGKENDLGNPTTDGYILSSTSSGTRSWIEPPQNGGSIVIKREVFVSTSGQTDFVITGAVAGEIMDIMNIHVNGAQQNPSEYSVVTTTVSRDTVRFASGLDDNDEVLIEYFNNISGITVAGVSEFISLTDTPSSYLGEANKLVAVKSTEDGLEFVTVSAGTGDMTKAVYDPTGIGGDAFDWNNFINVPSTFTPSAHTHTASDIVDFNSEVNSILSLSSINIHSDVDTVSSPPSIGDLLTWDGSNWSPGIMGSGDMTKSVYDPTNVNDDAFDWNNIHSTPSSYPPSSHNHTSSDITDFSNAVTNNVDVIANTADRHTHTNKSALDDIIDDGDGTKYLSDDGTYKTVSGSSVSMVIKKVLFNGTDGQTDFVMPNAVTNEILEAMNVHIDGAFQYKDQYSITTTTVTNDTISLVNGLDGDQEVSVEYFNEPSSLIKLDKTVDVIQISSNYTLTDSNLGSIIEVTGSNDIILTLPNGLDKGFNVAVELVGTGKITFHANYTLTPSNDPVMSAQYGMVSIYNAGLDVWRVNGDLD